MRTFIVGFWLASTLAAGVAVGQQAPFNEAGVTMGHWQHLVSHDVAANKKIFVAMGGTPVTRGTAEGVRFPGARVNLNVGEEPPGKGGSVGSVINHVGFIVKPVNISVLPPACYRVSSFSRTSRPTWMTNRSTSFCWRCVSA
jgi:hypothetical protein